MEDKDPYPALLGIYWAYENYVFIDLKRDTMMFEADGVKLAQPLDPYMGLGYIDLVDNNMESEVLI
jgi:hypothetical protein